MPEVIHSTCNMGARDSPDMYALSPRACGPRASGIHIRQIPRAHVTTITCGPSLAAPDPKNIGSGETQYIYFGGTGIYVAPIKSVYFTTPNNLSVSIKICNGFTVSTKWKLQMRSYLWPSSQLLCDWDTMNWSLVKKTLSNHLFWEMTCFCLCLLNSENRFAIAVSHGFSIC